MADLTTQEIKLFDKVWKLWDEGESRADDCKKYFDYWDGKLNKSHAALFSDQKKSTSNVIKEIIECKLDNMLDAQFTIGVVPVLNSFVDFKQLKDLQNIADIYNDEVHNILRFNNWDGIKARIGRWGLICGHGINQVTLDTTENAEGDIKLKDIEPQFVRWNKGAKDVSDLTFIAYKLEMNPSKVKEKYASKGDTWDIDLCNKIDDLVEHTADNTKGRKTGIVSLKTDESSDLAYVYDSRGLNDTSIVKLVVMFIFDDTLTTPEKTDDAEESQEKVTYKKMYPNGRMITFSEDKSKRVILEDKPAPDGFKDLGNIDIFNPIDFIDLWGKGEVVDLIDAQDRINGARLKQRNMIANHVNTICLDSGLDISLGDNDFVNQAVTHLDGIGRDSAKTPQVLTNNSISDAQAIDALVDNIKDDAYSLARLNKMIVTGEQPKGVTSADQLDILQESPMATIRAIQRNFKDFVIRVTEKIIYLIQNNYNVHRIIKLASEISTPQGQATMAQINPPDEKGQNSITLLSEEGEALKTIFTNKDWKFRVEVVAGTDIPRSRREIADIMNKLVQGQIIDVKDIDVLEMYLRSQDMPNYRALISLIKNKQEEAAKLPPSMPKVEDILKNKDLAMAFADILKGLTGHDQAIQQILKAMGLVETPNTIETTPVDQITAKSQVVDVASVSPNKISSNPQVAETQNVAATKVKLVEHNIG